MILIIEYFPPLQGTPISKNVTVKVEEKDKSSKRKSNLNRGLPNEKTGTLSSGDSTTGAYISWVF
jgi:hypothetical protein